MDLTPKSDSTREISGEAAAAIAEQARTFGQEDDITVVGVEWSAVSATTIAG